MFGKKVKVGSVIRSWLLPCPILAERAAIAKSCHVCTRPIERLTMLKSELK